MADAPGFDADGVALCERVLDLVGPGADATVRVVASHRGLTRFAGSFIHQNLAEDTVSVTLTLTVGGRAATAATTAVDGDGLARLVAGTREAALLRPPDPHDPGVAPAAAPVPVDHWDEATAAADPAARAAVVAAFVDAAGGLETAGYCATAGTTVTVATSAGLRLSGRETTADVSGVARTGRADGSGAGLAATITALDGAAAGARAATTARAASDAVEVPPGEYEVVLDPPCVASVLDFLCLRGFNAKMHIEGQSFVHLGEQQFDASVHLVDDAADPRTVGLGFDPEGTPRQRLELVTAGRTTALAYDRRSAHRQGVAPTGHAAGDPATGAFPANLFLAGGGRTSEELVGGVERGLLVKGFWYLRPLDPKTQVVTGLTRNGLFLVEDGEVRAAAANLRFTQSFVGALAPGNVRGIGDDARLATGDLSALVGFAHHVPSLHLASWRFTGGAQG